MDFFGMGFGEILFIIIIALIIFGPGRIPEFASTLGRMMRNLKKATTEVTTMVNKELSIAEAARQSKPVTDASATEKSKNITDKVPNISPPLSSPGTAQDNKTGESNAGKTTSDGTEMPGTVSRQDTHD